MVKTFINTCREYITFNKICGFLLIVLSLAASLSFFNNYVTLTTEAIIVFAIGIIVFSLDNDTLMSFLSNIQTINLKEWEVQFKAIVQSKLDNDETIDDKDIDVANEPPDEAEQKIITILKDGQYKWRAEDRLLIHSKMARTKFYDTLEKLMQKNIIRPSKSKTGKIIFGLIERVGKKNK